MARRPRARARLDRRRRRGRPSLYGRRQRWRPTTRRRGDDRAWALATHRGATGPVLTKTSSATGHAPAAMATVTPRRRLPRTVRPARTTRRVARVPSRTAIGALLVPAAVGVKATVAPRTASVRATAAPARDARDITAQGFAQAFARAYLSWDARDAEQHQRQVAPFLSGSLDGDGGLQVPAHGRQQVLWSTAIQDQPDARRDRVITVAVQTTREVLYVAVAVHGTDRGFLVVRQYPSLVGPPVSDRAVAPAEEPDVTDGGLRAVAQRGINKYLGGERTNLFADLDAGAVVSLPTATLHVRSVRSITWAARDRVAVEVSGADATGTQWTLRYELAVVHRDRWYVRTIETTPAAAAPRP